MDYTFIAAALQNQWNLWNIRGLMILSLCMQLVLALVAPLRQLKSNRFVIFVVWSAYILADWAAMFAFGLISNAGCRNLENSDVQVPPDVLALWAAFLLVHLGGPDTITAFSMEDNALWTRHLVGLIAQVSVFMYIFVKTLPNNRLLAPTILILVAGVINYGERTRALYLASLENLKKTIDKPTVSEQWEDIRVFHSMLKGLVVDIVPDPKECNESWAAIMGDTPAGILDRISREQRLLYELLYTRIKAANSTRGKIARAITYYCTLVAFILFCIGHKHQFHGGDLVITYALFVGVFVLQVANSMTIMASSFTNIRPKTIISLALGQGIFPPLVLYALAVITYIFAEGSTVGGFLFGRGRLNRMASFNILSHCFKRSTLKKGWKLGFIWNKVAGERHVSWEGIDHELWSSICFEIKENAKETTDASGIRELYETRGDRVLRKIGHNQLMPYIKGFPYEKTLLIWHIATEICIHMEAREDYRDNYERRRKRKFSKKLSDYMMHLLVRRPKLMSAVAGISHIRYRDTCKELKLLGSKLEVPTMREFCESILRERAIEEKDHGFSVLEDSCDLADLLRENKNMWEVIYKVWVELLSYAAGHCRGDSHARLLSQGSEFITALWILMSLCGISDQFPIK